VELECEPVLGPAPVPDPDAAPTVPCDEQPAANTPVAINKTSLPLMVTMLVGSWGSSCHE
jgi:hypothetical protein